MRRSRAFDKRKPSVVSLTSLQMNAVLRKIPTLMLVLAAGWMGACAHLATSGTAKGDAAQPDSGNLSAREREQVRQSLVPHPIPENPTYVKARLPCLFFAEHPGDQSMVPVGMLERVTFLVLRKRDGQWLDVRLTSGQLGSVMGDNISDLTEVEDSAEEYLDPQPDLKPLSLPQASNTRSEIDPVLLGG